MRPIARMLEDRYRVLNIDLPGHGRTPPPEKAMGIEDCAALVARVIEGHGSPPASVVGHSNGGRIALFMASTDEYAPLLKRLILISPSGIRPRRRLKVRLKSLLVRILKLPFSVLPKPYRDKGLEWLRDSAVWRMLGSTDYRTLSGVMRETFVKTVNFFVDDRIDRISAPTLIFWGDRDQDVLWPQIQKLVAAIPDSGVVTLKGAGHYGYIDDPATVSAGVRRFLDDL